MRAADPLSSACRGSRDSTGFCNCLGDERPTPRHIADLQVLLFHNVSHLNLLLEITRLFTFKGVPLIGKKNVKSRKNHFIHRPESRHHTIKRGRATDEPTDQTSQTAATVLFICIVWG